MTKLKIKNASRLQAARTKLKFLFIPHQDNNYQPHALHPHRLIFHGLGAILVKVFVMAVVLLMPITAYLTPDIMSAESKKILNLTNDLRVKQNVPLLVENQALDQGALFKAQDMLVNQYFAHVSPTDISMLYWLKQVGYQFAVAGENLALGFSSAEEVVNAWQRSKSHYSNMIDPDFKEIGVAMVAGNFHEHDTTLAVQFFGTEQAPAATQIKNPAPSAATQAADKKTQTIVKNIKPIKTAVKSFKIVNLETPVLIFPATGYVSSQSETDLKISAPGSQNVVIMNNGNQLAEIQADLSGNADLKIVLPEGNNQLVIKAISGNQTKESAPYALTVDTTAPLVDQQKSKIQISQDNNNDEKIVSAQAYLSPDTVSAQVSFNNYEMNLQPDSSEPGKWEGSLIIFNQAEEQIFNPVVLATLTAKDAAGNELVTDINWQNIEVLRPSLLSQYFYVKNHQTNSIKPIFNISSIYFQILLVIAIIALVLNIFIEIRKQRPHIIASTLGLITLLLFLIIL